MKALLKRWILGTALEPIARKAVALVRPGGMSCSAAYDLQTLEVMRRVLTRNSNCMDVGCHAGSILQHMVRLAPLGTMLAFEPIPVLAEDLKHKFGGRSTVHVHQVALADRAGTSTFHVVRGTPTLSGLRPRDLDPATLDRIEVRTDTLDAVVQPSLPIRFVKVDVEGAELQVLAGGAEMLRRDRPFVVFEHGKGGADYFGTRPEHLYDLLVGQCGLKISLMADWLRDPATSPLSRQAFCSEFDHHRNYYFMAHS